MTYQLLADAVMTFHFAFILLVAFGAVAVLRWPRLAWIQLPAAVWGALVIIMGWVCPLTPLETRLRQLSGAEGLDGGFIAHYIEPMIYPPGMTRAMQMALGAAVVAINLGCYGLLWWRHHRHQRQRHRGPD